MTDAGDTRRMTYAELGAARGISAASAKRLALRHGWPKAGGNDGLARIDVPMTALETSPATPPVMTPAISVPVAGDTSPGTVPVALLARVQRDAEDAIRSAQAETLQERERREAAETAAARAQGEAAGLREAVRLAEDSARRADATAAEARQREAAAMHTVQQIQGRAEQVPVLEAEAIALRDTAAREAARADAAEAARQAAEHEREAERAARQAAEAGRDIARAAVEASERRWEAAEAVLAEVSGGGRLRRVWTALWRRS